jgi:hypothetical protein
MVQQIFEFIMNKLFGGDASATIQLIGSAILAAIGWIGAIVSAVRGAWLVWVKGKREGWKYIVMAVVAVLFALNFTNMMLHYAQGLQSAVNY